MDVRFCGECKDERVFEVPPCEDGHGLDCVDLACVECGFALTGVLLVVDDVVLVEAAAA